jgi:hypothetical protein
MFVLESRDAALLVANRIDISRVHREMPAAVNTH